jgi:hypothetical protein
LVSGTGRRHPGGGLPREVGHHVEVAQQPADPLRLAYGAGAVEHFDLDRSAHRQ